MPTTPEEIKEITDALREEIHGVELLVRSAINDLRELYGTPDVDGLVSDIEPEGDEDDQ
jgi:archaellum component FlaC